MHLKLWEKNMKGLYPLRLKATSKDFGATVYIVSTISEWKQEQQELLKKSLQIRVLLFSKYPKYYYLNTEFIVIY